MSTAEALPIEGVSMQRRESVKAVVTVNQYLHFVNMGTRLINPKARLPGFIFQKQDEQNNEGYISGSMLLTFSHKFELAKVENPLTTS